jgi:hypothetical protein
VLWKQESKLYIALRVRLALPTFSQRFGQLWHAFATSPERVDVNTCLVCGPCGIHLRVTVRTSDETIGSWKNVMSAYFSTLAALAGSVIGGLTSLLAAWLTKRSEAEAQQLAEDRDRRQNLYKQFIDEASRMYADALSHDQVQVSAFVSIYALISRMRVISSAQVVVKAEKIVNVIANTYSSPNMDFRELRKLLNSHHIDVLRDFSEVCREELTHLPRSAI